ncbi:DUF21 domain-containing protein [candidate division KSB1 bacterium]|nr:DUF21 domain-containing protein [candidate division KSB1 bacterium]
MENTLFIITLLLSGYFSGSETAYVSANRLKLYTTFGEKRQTWWSDILFNQEQFLTTTLVGNNIVMVACSSLSIFVFGSLVPESLLVIVTTLFLLIFGEIGPKTVARQIPNRLVRITPLLMTLFFYLLYPLVVIAHRVSQGVINMTGGDRGSVSLFFQKRDLPLLVRKYTQTSQVSLEERQFITRAIKIGNKRLEDVMIPRTDIQPIEIHSDRHTIVRTFERSGFSRLPVFEEDLDHILGFLYIHDFITRPEKNIRELIRPAMVLPEHSRVFDALAELRTLRKSIALVVDEHGGTAGIVTLEDLIEELVGRINDEFDLISDDVKRIDKWTFIASGRAEIDELEEKYQLRLPVGEYVTLGGLIEYQLGTIPTEGEEIIIGNYHLTVLRADERRILEVRIRIDRKHHRS